MRSATLPVARAVLESTAFRPVARRAQHLVVVGRVGAAVADGDDVVKPDLGWIGHHFAAVGAGPRWALSDDLGSVLSVRVGCGGDPAGGRVVTFAFAPVFDAVGLPGRRIIWAARR